jgi:hypothetical protein
MIKKLAGIVILVGFATMAFGQETTTTATTTTTAATATKKTGRPNIPGILALELGINGHSGAPANFRTGFWGSRTVNIYYQLPFQLFNSGFSFVPGIGFGLERFKFKNNYTINYSSPTSGEIVLIAPADAAVPNIRKSQLIANYIDIPIEIRFSTKPDDPARSFNVSVGGRIGYLFDSFTKLKYKENSEIKKIKYKQNFQLTEIRYGLTGRIGFGDFSIFGYYNLTPLFEEGKGLMENNQYKDFNTFTIGISLASF